MSFKSSSTFCMGISQWAAKGYIPFRVIHRYNDTLDHKMFLRTSKTTIHVYIHKRGLKATFHDTLEPIRNIGRVPTWAREAPGGRSSRMKFWVLSTSTKKKFLRVPPRYTLFAPWNVAFYVVIVICGPLPSIILYRISVYFIQIS